MSTTPKINHKSAEWQTMSGKDRLIFRSSRDPGTGCLEWLGPYCKDGYGRTKFRSKHYRCSRLAWELWKGPIPEGMMVCHRCDNPKCIEISHLFLGTQHANIHDAKSKKRHRSKLTRHQAIEILRSAEPRQALAERFSVHVGTISEIRAGRTWASIQQYQRGANG